MTEHEQTGCNKVYSTGEGQPTSMDMVITRRGKFYLISIATPTFIEELRQYNEGLDPSIQIGEKYFPMDEIPSAEEVCRRLSRTPFEILQPYLVEQITDPVDGAGFEPAASSM